MAQRPFVVDPSISGGGFSGPSPTPAAGPALSGTSGPPQNPPYGRGAPMTSAGPSSMPLGQPFPVHGSAGAVGGGLNADNARHAGAPAPSGNVNSITLYERQPASAASYSAATGHPPYSSAPVGSGSTESALKLQMPLAQPPPPPPGATVGQPASAGTVGQPASAGLPGMPGASAASGPYSAPVSFPTQPAPGGFPAKQVRPPMQMPSGSFPPSASQAPYGQVPSMSGPRPMGVPSQGHPPMGVPSQGPPPMGVPSQGPPPMGVPSQGPPPMGVPSQGPPQMSTHPQGPPPTGMPSQAPPSMGGPSQGPPVPGISSSHGPPPPMGSSSQGLPPTGMPPQGAAAGSGPRGRYPQPVSYQPPAETHPHGHAVAPPPATGTLLEKAVYPPGAAPPATHPAPAAAPAQYGQAPITAQPVSQPHSQMGSVTQAVGNMSMAPQQQPAIRAINLMANRTVLPAQPSLPLKPSGANYRGVVPANPEYIRSTLTVVPESRDQLDHCRLPFGIILQPFRQMSHAEMPLIRHLVMVRCSACRAYFHPFVTFLNSHQWQCSLCYRTNAVPDAFYNADPQRENHRTRPELRCCSVEYLAPPEYAPNPPAPACYVFLIEVTAASQRVGLLENICKILAKHFASLPGDARRQISIMTYGRGIGFYAFKPGAVQPQMYMVNDLDDLGLPVPSTDLKVNIEEFQEMLQDFFEQLPAIHGGVTDSENCLGSAMQTALQLVNKSGRVTVFQASMPNIGQGILKPADPANKEPKLNASSGFYKELSLEFNQQQIAIDLFAFGVKPLDLASTGGLCQYSSGQVYFYSDSLPSSIPHAERFHRDFARYLTRDVGFDAIMRLRCSYGVTMEAFYGNFFHPRSDNLSMPNLNPDLTLGVQLAIEDKLPRKGGAVTLQTAVLYTTSKGERRTRVTTVSLPTSSNVAEVFDGADVEGIALLVSRMAAANAPASLANAREGVSVCAVDFLKSFQKNVVGQPGQGLLVPQSLSLLPLFLTGLLASPAFSQFKSLGMDDRVYGIRLLDQLPVSQAMRFIYPYLYAVHDLGEEHATSNESGGVHYSPARLQPSIVNLSPAGIYLLDAGLTLFIWIGQSATAEVVQDLFDVEAFGMLPETQGYLPLLDNPKSMALNSFVRQLRKPNSLFAPLYIVRADSAASTKMLHRLVDDSDHGIQEHSYYSFLTRIDKAVKSS